MISQLDEGQGQGHRKVKIILWSVTRCFTFYQQVGGGPSTERHSSTDAWLKQ